MKNTIELQLIMNKSISREEIMALVEKKDFDNEKEFEEYMILRLKNLFRVEEKQINYEITTTPFEYKGSKRADIVIRSKDTFGRILIVIELKLERSIQKFHDDSWESAVKQLHEYSQDVRATYGILMTEEKCLIYRYRWYMDKQDFQNHPSSIPNIRKVEEQAIRSGFLEALLHERSQKYLYLFAIILVLMGESVYLIGPFLQKQNWIFVLIVFLLMFFFAVRVIIDLIKIEK